MVSSRGISKDRMSAQLKPPQAKSNSLIYYRIYDCYYYITNQITTSAIVDLAVTIVMAFVPILMFRIKLFMSNKGRNENVTFNLNYFESIDRFY